MFVVKIGGSILFDDKDQINTKLISKYAKTIRNVFTDANKKCAIVVGGGKIARKYISASRELGASEAQNDLMGIEAAKLNARLLINALGEKAYPIPPNSFQHYQELTNLTDKIIVCGGFTPGQSTNAVAAAIAEISRATKLINMTDVDGVYSEDPDKNPNAKLFSEINIEDFLELIANNQTKAGQYPLFDNTAVQIIKRSKIPVHFINGTKVENLSKAVSGSKIGTLIIH